MSVAVVFFVYSLMYPYTSDIGPGPGFLPFWLSIALFVLSISYMYVVFKGEDSVEPMPDKQGRKNIVFILSCMIVFVVMLPLLGFIVSGTVFLYVLFIKAYRWHIALFTALGTSVFLFLLFSKFLQVNLPVNMFGF
jgi:putative tricarboxylic transport membrane protein